MKINGRMPLGGYFTLSHYRDGKLLSEERIRNTITNNGLERCSGLINGVSTGAFDCLRIGTSGTAAAAANTNLLAGITTGSLAGAAATCTQVTTDTTNDSAKLLHTWSATATYTIKEAGVFTSATTGAMLARKTFDAKAMVSGDTLQVTYTIDLD